MWLRAIKQGFDPTLHLSSLLYEAQACVSCIPQLCPWAATATAAFSQRDFSPCFRSIYSLPKLSAFRATSGNVLFRVYSSLLFFHRAAMPLLYVGTNLVCLFLGVTEMGRCQSVRARLFPNFRGLFPWQTALLLSLSSFVPGPWSANWGWILAVASLQHGEGREMPQKRVSDILGARHHHAPRPWLHISALVVNSLMLSYKHTYASATNNSVLSPFSTSASKLVILQTFFFYIFCHGSVTRKGLFGLNRESN